MVFAAVPLEPMPFRMAVAWNIGVFFYVAHVFWVMRDCEADCLRKEAQQLAVRSYVLYSLMLFAIFWSLYLSLTLQAEAKDEQGLMKALEFSFALLTVVMSWLFLHVMFTVHYAHHYYKHDRHAEPESEDAGEGGLKFPKCSTEDEEPDFWDFLYFSFVIGMTFQVSDVEITRRHMRHVALTHSVIAFFFYTFILALSINIAAGAFE